MKKNKIEIEIDAISNQIMTIGMTNNDYESEKLLREQYLEILKREEIYWKDTTRELWIVDGDLNTKFFHASSKARRINNKIFSIKDDNGYLKTSVKDTEKSSIDYFTNLLGNGNLDNNSTFPLIIKVIKTLITNEDCEMLQAPYTLEEIKCATFSLHPHKGNGPDGMTAKFFQNC